MTNVAEAMFPVYNVMENVVEKRKYWLPVFSLFSTMFSDSISFGVVNSEDCVAMVLEAR